MSWIGFNTAVTGLMGNQRKIHIANHNIASADREGYSRQTVKEAPNTAHNVAGFGFVGLGTQLYDVVRERSEYIDFKYRKESSAEGEWAVKSQSLLELEGTLKGTGEHGISISVDEFFSSMQDLSTNPSDNSYKMSFRQKVEALSARISETAHSLKRQQSGINSEVAFKIKEANDLAKQVGNINAQIFSIEIDGKQANDLRDQRDLIIDKMSKIVDIDIEEHGGKMTVRAGGAVMVDHDYVKSFKYPPAVESSTIDPSQSLYQLEWEDGDTVIIKSGELKGLLDSRDGNGKDPAFDGLPYYADRLDEFASNFADKVNAIFESGKNSDGETGLKLFDSKDGKAIGAMNITISKEVKESLDNIVTGSTGFAEDSDILAEIIGSRGDKKFFSSAEGAMYSGTPEDFLTSIVSTLGTESQYSDRMEKTQGSVIEYLEKKRMSDSGVDLNEEMNGVVKFQQLYNASAKMISVFDEIMDTTISRLGLAGR